MTENSQDCSDIENQLHDTNSQVILAGRIFIL